MKKFVILIALIAFTTVFSHQTHAVSKNLVYILCYHSFLGTINASTDFSPDTFKTHIEDIYKLGYKFVSLEDIKNNRIEGSLNVLITIDDGNRSIRNIYGLFEEYNIKPVLFIYPAVISRMRYALTYSDLSNYIHKGASIGGHGWFHEKVNMELYLEGENRFKKEIYNPKTHLQNRLNVGVSAYAYPFGIYSDITVEHIEKAGYKFAFTIEPYPLEMPVSDENRFTLPRFMVTKGKWSGIYNELKENSRGKKQSVW
jgi:peptidoglycan/xylan/chitin deacetylase (PgdA/CDA1 family)